MRLKKLLNMPANATRIDAPHQAESKGRQEGDGIDNGGSHRRTLASGIRIFQVRTSFAKLPGSPTSMPRICWLAFAAKLPGATTQLASSAAGTADIVTKDDRISAIPTSHRVANRSWMFDSEPAGYLENKRSMVICPYSLNDLRSRNEEGGTGCPRLLKFLYFMVICVIMPSYNFDLVNELDHFGVG